MVVNGTASAHCAYLFFSTVTVPSNLCISTSLPDELRSGIDQESKDLSYYTIHPLHSVP